MKIRNGFVSNSSSSSFVVVVEKSAYDEEILKLDPLHQALAGAVFYPTTVFGKECMLYDKGTGNDGCHWFDEVDIDGIIERAQELANEQNCAISSDHDDNYASEDMVRDGFYSMGNTFQIKDKSWSHRMDW